MNADELALEEKRPEMLRAAETLLSRYGLSRDDAEDFLQDALLRMLGKVESLNLEELPGLYYATIRGLVKNHVRDEERHEDWGEEYQHVVTVPDSQAQMQQRERLNVDVELAMTKLDEQTRRIVQMLFLEKYTYREIYQELKISPNTTVEAVAAAVPILQDALAQYDHRPRREVKLIGESIELMAAGQLSPAIWGDRRHVSQPVYRQVGNAKEYDVAFPERHRPEGGHARPVIVETYNVDGQLIYSKYMTARTFKKRALTELSHVPPVSPRLSIAGLGTDQPGIAEEVTA